MEFLQSNGQNKKKHTKKLVPSVNVVSSYLFCHFC
jgi:hypothetical protein